jgi:type IX secretion system substrate protein
MNRLIILLFLLVLASASISAQNIMISDTLKPNEPSIIIDPKQPNKIYAGANLNGIYTSQDTGRTWHIGQMYSTYGVWGDPVLVVDTLGNVFYFHLSNVHDATWIDRIVCQKMQDGEKSFDSGHYIGLNGTKQQDKEWAVVDTKTNNIYMTWTQFDKYGSNDPLDRSNIMFSRTTDEGETWSMPLRINEFDGNCLDNDNTVEGSVPAVGPNGEIYVSWSAEGGIYFDRSTNGGTTWLDNDIFVTEQPGGWVFNIPGINRSNGMPITKCDLSGGEHHGTIYVNWTDQRFGIDDTDVWLAKSVDGGDSWSEPIRVNNDNPGKHNFLTWMAIDQTNGYLYVVFYDRRNYTDNETDVYIAYSTNGGESFVNKRISEKSFVPRPDLFFGDYISIDAVNGIIRPIWTRIDAGNTSLWTHLVTHEELITSVIDEKQLPMSFNSTSNYPNPANDMSYVSFKLRESSLVSISLINSIGSVIHEPVVSSNYGYGKHIVQINISRLNLAPGFYYYLIKINGEIRIEKLIIGTE